MQVASTPHPTSPIDFQFLDRFELIEWAEPVIADRLSDFYRDAASADKASDMVIRHRRLWRDMILDHHAALSISRKELQRLGTTASLPPGFLEKLDQEIMEELLEIVLSRYGASRASIKRFGLILMIAAANLGAARALA